MTDIVERLHRIACKHSETTDVAVVMGQAADEIERLRKDIMNLEGYLSTQRDEIERLQVTVVAGDRAIKASHADCDQYRAEIERLTFQNKGLLEMNAKERSHNTGWATRWNDAMGEIEQLRALITSTRLPQCGCGRDPKTMSLLEGLKP